MKPYRFQLEDVDRITEFEGRCLLANEMGTMKTSTALRYAQENKSMRPIVAICPASLKWHWLREAATHINMRAEVLEGRKPPKRSLLSSNTPLVVINYDILGPWIPFLQRLEPQLVIIDECHRIGNHRTLRTTNTRLLCRDVPHVIALSGTPFTNYPAQLFPVLNILRPDLFPSFFNYADEYCGPELKPWGWTYNGARNLDKLHKLLLANLMIRRRKADVLSQLPAKSRYVVPMDMSDRAQYHHAHRDFLGWLRQSKKGNVYRAKKAEQLVKVGYLKRLAAILKMPSVFDWVDDFLADSDEKIILFAIQKEIVAGLQATYRGQSVVISGSTPTNQRQKVIDQFSNSKKTRILIGNLDAAGVGWDGTAATNVAFVEMGWTPGQHTQAEDRPHRPGQHYPVSIHYLIARGTVEEHLCSVIQQKQEVLDATLDGRKVEDLDILDLLLEKLEEQETVPCL